MSFPGIVNFSNVHVSPSPNESTDNYRIDYEDKRGLTLEDLKDEVQQDLTKRCVDGTDIDKFAVDDALEFSFPSIAKARKAWDNTRPKHVNIKTGSLIAGVAIFVFGAWKSITKKSPLWAIGTAVSTVVAIYLHRAARSSIQEGNENLLTLKKTCDWSKEVAQFRQQVIVQGLGKLKDLALQLPAKLQSGSVINLFTPEEISILLIDWIESIKKQHAEKTSRELVKLILEHDVLKWVLEDQAQNAPLIPIIQTFRQINNGSLEQMVKTAIDRNKDAYRKKYEACQRDNPNFFQFFTERNSPATQMPDDEITQEALESLFADRLDFFQNQLRGIIFHQKTPDKVWNDEKMTDKLAVYFRGIFAGYSHLYDHLIHMKSLSTRNERSSEIEKMTFSEISHIVLETRDAVIQKVMSSIPADRNNILFLLGTTGAGKSTTLCFLRGDEMVLNGSKYESKTDRSGLIGHEPAASCTFLPTVEVLNDLVVVDFAGFEDTNEQIISLGMEFALIALIKRYQPKVLVLESITNTAGRFASAAKLGARLNRLIDNKKDCILGLTRYSQDWAVRRIKALEEAQKRTLSTPTQEELELAGGIRALSKMTDPESVVLLQEKQQELAKLKQEREQKLQQPLPDTDEKTRLAKEIEKTEHDFLEEIGLESIIRFCDLEDPSRLSSCLATLSKQESIRIRSVPSLDSDDRGLLENRFKNDLVKEMETKENYSIGYKDFAAFEESVSESSLISTVFAKSNPEIGKFLHSPEIDPKIVRSCDREIIESCIKKYMQFVIGSLDISSINEALTAMGEKAPHEKVVTLNVKLTEVRDWLLGILGAESEKPPEHEWERFHRQYKASRGPLEKQFMLPTWVSVCQWIPQEMPQGLFTLLKWNAKKPTNQKLIAKTIDACCYDLDQIVKTLSNLRKIEKIFDKQDAADQQGQPSKCTIN